MVEEDGVAVDVAVTAEAVTVVRIVTVVMAVLGWGNMPYATDEKGASLFIGTGCAI